MSNAHTPQPNSKKHYRAPTFKVYGDIRNITLGTSPGTGEGHGGNAMKAVAAGAPDIYRQ